MLRSLVSRFLAVCGAMLLVPGCYSWARTGGTVTVYTGAALQISSGTLQVNSPIDPFTDSTATGTDTTKSAAITVTGGTLEYTGASTSGVQLNRLASLNISSGSVVLDAASTGESTTGVEDLEELIV